MVLEVEVMYANNIMIGVLFIALTSALGIFVFLTTKRKTDSPKETRKGGTKNGSNASVRRSPRSTGAQTKETTTPAVRQSPSAAPAPTPAPAPRDLSPAPAADATEDDLELDMEEDMTADAACTAPSELDGAAVADPELRVPSPQPEQPAEDAPPSPRLSGPELTPSMARRQRRKRMKQRTAAAPSVETGPPPPPPEEQRLDLPAEVVYQLMRRYTLPAEQLHMLGFPHSSSFHRGKAYIYKGMAGSPRSVRKVKLDAAAKEFVPRALASSDCDSGTHSSEGGDDSSAASSGSEPDEQSPDDVSETESVQSSGSENGEREPRTALLRPHCVRCSHQFAITTDGYYHDSSERCVFHWGKLKAGRTGTISTYACCGGRPGGRGCSTASCHVWSGLLHGLNGPLKGYVRSRRRRVPPADGNFGVYALDCEMCYTGQGLELARVSVVGLNGKRVYDALVRPERPVVDYNTRFSGITARQLDRATKTLRAVQSDLMGFISADTVLIGHGLENDLRALRLVHDTVVDTSVVFPHYLGLPYRRRLSHITSSCLGWSIQQDGASRGHDSLEDARACMQLLLYRIRRDMRL